MQRWLHSACATRFIGAQRVVEPNIAAGGEHAPHLHVVFLDECNATLEASVMRKSPNHLCKLLPTHVLGMRLASEDDLHGTILGGQNAQDAFHIMEDQRRAFVGCKAPRKPDGERIVAECFARTHEVERAFAARHGLAAQARSHESNQLVAQCAAHCPEVGVSNGRNRCPWVGVRR